jgi:hypothetical protein
MSRLVSAAPAFVRGVLLPIGTPILGAALVVFGIVALDRLARGQLHGSARNELAFADIPCEAPAGLSRPDFLGEVQYLAHLPDRLDRLEPNLADSLRRAFALHPWVEAVERVEVPSGGSIQVRLRYRTPVLAVRDGDRLRAVDRHAVLLPESAPTAGLIVYHSPARPPHGRAGTPWGDERLEGAASAAALLAPYREGLNLADLEWTARGLVFVTAAGSSVLWGQPPGAESAREAAPLRKRDRLLHYRDEHGSLDAPNPPCEHDVRWADE